MSSPAPGLTKVAEVRVLYADTDQMAVVNNAIYLRWFEIGRAEWIRGRGRSYREIERAGVLLPVVEAHVCYRKPARYDDLVAILAGPSLVGAATITFAYALNHAVTGELLCDGWTRHACLDPDGKIRRLPAEVLDMLRDAD
jgi:acyl-CoA thioester hydrolase